LLHISKSITRVSFTARGFFFGGNFMTAFKSSRVIHEYTQTNPASPDKVFPLLCPVREADWLPGWQYRLIYSDSSVAELGCIFTTPNPPTSASRINAATETTWIVTEYDPSVFRIAFVWFNPGSLITEILIQLTPDDSGTTRTHIRYRYTGLSPEGNREIESYDRKWFEAKMQNWEATMNHYLRTIKKLSA
jgi:hypothetical protein